MTKSLFQLHKKRHAEIECCACQDSPFLFSHYIIVNQPLEDVDKKNHLFESVKSKLKGKVSADSFDKLSSSRTRWLFHWFYAVNCFQFGGGEAQKLPSSLVNANRGKYPDPSGSYTEWFHKK